MNKKMGKYSIILGFFGLLIAMNMDTTVAYDGERVFNIGLISKQQNTIILSAAILIYGILVKLFGKSEEKSKYTPFDGERNIANQNYQLFLVRKYLIEKNQTIEKYSIGDQVFDNLNLALEKANRDYEAELTNNSHVKTSFSIWNIFSFSKDDRRLMLKKIGFGLSCVAATGLVTMVLLYPDIYRIYYILLHDDEFDLVFYGVLILVFIISITKGEMHVVRRRVYIILTIIAIVVMLLKVSIYM